MHSVQPGSHLRTRTRSLSPYPQKPPTVIHSGRGVPPGGLVAALFTHNAPEGHALSKVSNIPCDFLFSVIIQRPPLSAPRNFCVSLALISRVWSECRPRHVHRHILPTHKSPKRRVCRYSRSPLAGVLVSSCCDIAGQARRDVR